ncbi:unnamed protein product [Rotaria sordida]|uniref:Uncharacterized protein n=2 Tax=Rotaria sordida TaxID=392033 RepID=A0A816GT60_9BILA|nr:unnamed protein product [Rotaria sordida]CAF1678012.1 unnamed protein product [Rotaria sordida]
MKNKQVTDATDCSEPQLITKTSSNRVAAWHAQRNARESEASHLIWLDRESGARTAQRKKRSRLISITEHCSSFENNVDKNKNETGNKEMNEVREKTVGKLDNQSRQKNKLRKVRSLEERQEQRKTTLYYEVFYRLSDWCSRELLVNEQKASIGPDYEKKHQNIVRRVRSLVEREAKFENNMNHEAFSMSIQRCNRNLVETEGSRLIRVEKQAELKVNTRLIKDRLETREEHIQRLQLNNEYESMRSLKRCQSEIENEKISLKLHKRNHDQS